jgi:hypothetical protein
MRIQDIYIAVAVTAGEKLKVLYAGGDATEANEAYRTAGAEFVEVGVIAHPQIVMPRFPAEEAAAAEARAKAAEVADSAELLKAQQEANKAKAAAEAAAEAAEKAAERLRLLTDPEETGEAEKPADDAPKKKGKKAK